MGNRRIILELDREPQDLQAVWRLDSIARLIQQALSMLGTLLVTVQGGYEVNGLEPSLKRKNG